MGAIYKAAVSYVNDHKLPIIPLCPVNHLNMSGEHRGRCKTPGKAPILPKWSEHHDTTMAELEDWFRRNSEINIGLVLGLTENWNLVGVDVDGEIGEELLEKASKGDLPITWEYTTGNGRRLLYLLPGDTPSHKNRLSVYGESGECALIAQGQQTVVPPSKHHSGKLYRWVPGRSPDKIEIANAPTWILELVARDKFNTNLTYSQRMNGYTNEIISEPVTPQELEKPIFDGNRSVQMTRLVGSLVRKKRAKDTLEDILQLALDHNQEKVVPPLTEGEINKMVVTIWEKERIAEEKRAREKAKKEEGFVALEYTLKLIADEQAKGHSWKYIGKRGKFYKYEVQNPPWRIVEDEEMNQIIQRFLQEAEPLFLVRKNIGEIEALLKGFWYDKEAEDVFDYDYHVNKNAVYCLNGVLNVLTGELTSWSPDINTTIMLPVKWDEHARDSDAYELWLETLEEWVPDEDTRMFLQEYIGYCLVPDCSFRAALFLTGQGSNGKSLFIDIVKQLFIGHYSNLSLKRLGGNFSLSVLLDKLVNICSDIDGTFIKNTGELKGIIAGDEITGEYKFGKIFSFNPVARLIFSANSLPRVNDKSVGWYSRMKIVRFGQQFEVDPQYALSLKNALGGEEALSSLLYWAVEGLQRLRSHNKFTVAITMRETAKAYQMDNDNVVGFMEEILLPVPDLGYETRIQAAELYNYYREWCDEIGLKSVSQIEFAKRLEGAGIGKATKSPTEGSSSRVRCFIGVRFNTATTNGHKAYLAYKEYVALSHATF